MKHVFPAMIALIMMSVAGRVHAEAAGGELPSMETIQAAVQGTVEGHPAFTYQWTSTRFTPQGALTELYAQFDPAVDPDRNVIPAQDVEASSRGRVVWQGGSLRSEFQGRLTPKSLDEPEEERVTVLDGGIQIQYDSVPGILALAEITQPAGPGGNPVGDPVTCILNGSFLRREFEPVGWVQHGGRKVLHVSSLVPGENATNPDAGRIDYYLDPMLNYLPVYEMERRGDVIDREAEYTYAEVENVGVVPVKRKETLYSNNGGTVSGRSVQENSNFEANPQIDPAEFSVAVPAGTRIVNRAAGFNLVNRSIEGQDLLVSEPNVAWTASETEVLNANNVASRKGKEGEGSAKSTRTASLPILTGGGIAGGGKTGPVVAVLGVAFMGGMLLLIGRARRTTGTV